ncbi:MFS transporter [Enterococcus hirae]|nr:MFS transporter [Enterococcus hirae]
MPSLVLSLGGFSIFLWGLTNVAKSGWTNLSTVVAPILVGIILLVIFVLRQLKLKEPFLDVRVFKVKAFTIPTLAIILVMVAMYGVEMMLPTYLQNILGLSPFQSGLTLLGGALFMGILSPVSGFLFNKVGVKRLTLTGFSLLVIGTLPFVFFTIETSQHLIMIIYAIRMIGIALTLMPLTTSAMDALPQSMSAHASAANNTARQIGSSVAVALLSSVTQNVISTHLPNAALKTADSMAYASKALNASMDGFRASFALGLMFAIAGLIFSLFLANGKPKPSAEKAGNAK